MNKVSLTNRCGMKYILNPCSSYGGIPWGRTKLCVTGKNKDRKHSPGCWRCSHANLWQETSPADCKKGSWHQQDSPRESLPVLCSSPPVRLCLPDSQAQLKTWLEGVARKSSLVTAIKLVANYGVGFLFFFPKWIICSTECRLWARVNAFVCVKRKYLSKNSFFVY